MASISPYTPQIFLRHFFYKVHVLCHRLDQEKQSEGVQSTEEHFLLLVLALNELLKLLSDLIMNMF
jgi:hypothetical protein